MDPSSYSDAPEGQWSSGIKINQQPVKGTAASGEAAAPQPQPDEGKGKGEGEGKGEGKGGGAAPSAAVYGGRRVHLSRRLHSSSACSKLTAAPAGPSDPDYAATQARRAAFGEKMEQKTEFGAAPKGYVAGAGRGMGKK